MDQQALLSKWNELADWMFDLMGEGYEGAVLVHLASCPDAAEIIIDESSKSDFN